MKSIVIASLVLVALVSATQYVPIPSQPDGIGFGRIHANLTIDAWYDLTCPDSQYTYGELLTALKNETLAPYLNQIRINYHFMPLPYHFNSFYLAQAFKFVLENYGNDATLLFVDKVFENQDIFYSIFDKTANQIFQLIAENTASYLSAYNVTAQEVYDSYSDYDYNGGARASYKLGSGLTVTGTPTIFANDALINAGQDFAADDWVDFFLSVFEPQPDDFQQFVTISA